MWQKNMQDRYFDIVKFCSEYLLNKEIRRTLLAELDDISISAGIDYSETRIQCSPSTDGVPNTVVRRLSKQSEIDDINKYFEMFDNAYSQLTEDEQLVVSAFFMEGLNPTQTEVKLMEAGIPHTTAYRIRKKALEKMKENITQ